jgi:hypothetical protein
MSRLLSFVATIFTVLSSPSVSVAALQRQSPVIGCARLLRGRVVFRTGYRRQLMVETPGSRVGVSTVTYDTNYVLENLGLDKKSLPTLFSERSVVLVGNGTGGLHPVLAAAGAEIVSIDPLYAFKRVPRINAGRLSSGQTKLFDAMDLFLTRYRRQLMPGTAQSLPVESGSYDFYITHMVYNNFVKRNISQFDWVAVTSAIEESLRVLKKYGIAINVFQMGRPQDLRFLSMYLMHQMEQGKIESVGFRHIEYRYPKFERQGTGIVRQKRERRLSLFRLTIVK